MENHIEEELLYVYNNFEFSPECSDDMRNEMLSRGLVEDIEGTYVVSDLGESVLGMEIDESSDVFPVLDDEDVYEL